MLNTASSAKLYHELNLTEKKLRDGVRHQGMFLLLLSSWWFLAIFKTRKQTYKGCRRHNPGKKHRPTQKCRQSRTI